MMVDPVDRRSGSGAKSTEPQPASQPEPPESAASAQESQAPPSGAPGESHLPEPNFHLLMQMFFEQALFALGSIPGLPESERKVDLHLAKFQIALMEILQEKTKGNLSPMEEKYLDEYLHQARLAYVKASKEKTASQAG